MTQEINRNLKIIKQALNIGTDSNLRFSTWGDFNSTYLTWLSEAEKRQYNHLVFKFAVIHAYDKQGMVPSMHGDVEGFQAKIDSELKQLEEKYKV